MIEVVDCCSNQCSYCMNVLYMIHDNWRIQKKRGRLKIFLCIWASKKFKTVVLMKFTTTYMKNVCRMSGIVIRIRTMIIRFYKTKPMRYSFWRTMQMFMNFPAIKGLNMYLQDAKITAFTINTNSAVSLFNTLIPS